MADQQETFSDVQPIQQKAAPAADASAPQETFSDVTPIAVSKPPIAALPKNYSKPDDLPKAAGAPIAPSGEKAATQEGMPYTGVISPINSEEQRKVLTTPTATENHIAAPFKAANEKADKMTQVGVEAGREAGAGWVQGASGGASGMSPIPRQTPLTDEQSRALNPTVTGIAEGVGGFVGGTVADPRQVAMLVAAMPVAEAGPIFSRVLASGFAANMGKDTYEGVKALQNDWDSLTEEQRGERMGQLGITGLLTAATAYHASGFEPKTPEVKQAETNVKALETDRAAAQAAYDKALAEHNKHAASHAQGIQSPEKVVKELNKTKAALDEATAHHEFAKEELASKVAAQRAGTAGGKTAVSVKPTPAPAPEVPTEAIEAQPSPLKPLGTPEPAPAVAPPINVKNPGQVQPETFPQTPTERPRTPLGRIELAGGQGTMGKPPLLTEGTPEGPQLPPGGLPQIKIPEAPKPAPQPAAVDEAALRALSAKEGKVVETPEKKVGRLLQEAFKPTEKTKEATASETKEIPEEYKGEERRENARPATMTPTEIEEAMKNRKPVHTPFDVTQGAMDTIKRDQAMPKHPAEEVAKEKPSPSDLAKTVKGELIGSHATGKATPESDVDIKVEKPIDEDALKQHGYEYQSNSRISPKEAAEYDKPIAPGWSNVQHFTNPTTGSKVDVWSSEASPNEEPTGYAAKKEEVVPVGAEGREPVKSAAEYSPAVEQKVNELSDENLKKLAKAHGLNPDEYDFNARDERRHRVERDQLAKDITEQIGEDEKINLGRAAESAEREPGFANRDQSAKGRADRAAKLFPRLRGPVDEFGNPKVSGGKTTPKDFLEEIENHPDLKFSSEHEGDLENGKGTTVSLKAVSKPDRVRISDLQSPEKGKGGATDMLKTITDLADKRGIPLELTASPYGDEETRLNHDQLQAFYKKNGFVFEAGKDPALGYMVREPKSVESSNPKISGGAPDTVGTKEGAKSDTEHFANAKKELGENASISDVAKRAQEMKDAAKATSKYANPEKGIPETSLAKGPEAEAVHAATVASDKLAKSWETPDKESGTAKKPVDLKKVVGDYAKREGLGEVKDNNMEVDPRSKEIARAYDDMKHNPSDPEVKKSYDALIDDAKKQWDALTKAGIKLEPQDEDPYRSYDEMKKDFNDNKRLKVFRGGEELPKDHPLAKVDPKTGETYNVMFRAVHDAIGHLLHDNDFSEKGESNAFDTHRQTLSKEAIPAMTTETKAQVASYFDKGKFPEQKAGILPERFNEDAPDSKAILDHLKSGKDFALLTAENPNNTRATEAQNTIKNREMKAELEKMGYKPTPIEGHVKDVEGQKENSFFVPDITPEDAAKVSRKFGQASVMTKQGIHDLAKNTVHPSTGLLESPEAEKQDYHSTVAGKPFSIGVDFDKEVPVGKNNYHGEPLSYEHDNGDHKVVTTDKNGKKIGELLAKDSAPNTVEVVSNQVYDKDLRGKGRGVDQIQHLLEKVGDDIKSVKSDISTSKDARAAWDKLEKFAPEAVTKETFKDGQVQYSVDMEKWRGEHLPKISGGAPKDGVEGLKEKLPELAQKHLTEEEKNSLTTTATGKPRTAGTTKFIENMEKIPSVQEYKDIALAGEGARKWYSRSTAAFDAMHDEAPDYFKEGDKDKFMGVLAGSSPQQSVASNLRESLGFWKEWNDAGRPVPTLEKWKQFGEEADKAWKEDGSPRSRGLKTGASMHWDYAPQGPEWKTENLFIKNLTLPDTKVPNIIKALRGEDMWPDLTKNAAFKAPSFAENLRKWINGKSTGTKNVTNDSWMGLFGGIDKSALSKPENYHPLSVATRAAAEELGWEPEEAQAAIWSFTQALTEKGEEDPEIIRQYSEDFKDLLANDEQTRSKLEDLGVNLDQLDKKLEAIGEKPEISGRSTATTSRSVEQLRHRVEEARGKGAIPPAKSAQGELGFREPHPTRTPVDEAVGFNPEQFHTQTDEPLTKLGEKKKRSPLGKIGQ